MGLRAWKRVERVMEEGWKSDDKSLKSFRNLMKEVGLEGW